ncbi:MAG: FG-GAP repeat domain-containing protein [Solirubrobacteraceae bacterium]
MAKADAFRFDLPQHYAGPTPAQLAVGRLTSGRRSDVVTANTDNSVTVYLANADGTFQPSSTIQLGPPGGARTNAITIGDVNGDGSNDVVAASGCSIYVLLGRGDGTFDAPKTTPAPHSAGGFGCGAVQSLQLGRLGTDSAMDLVTADGFPPGADHATVSTLAGNNDGTFGNPQNYGVGSTYDTVWVVRLADFNHDGYLDVAAATNGAGATGTSVLLGTASSALQSPTYLGNPPGTGGTPPGGMTVADFNHDGSPDVLTVRWGVLAVRLGHGDGTFDDWKTTATSPGTASVTAPDLDHDGLPDVALTPGSSGLTAAPPVLAVQKGLGDGSFSTPPETYNQFDPGERPISYGDFRGNGQQDLVTVYLGYGGINIYLNQTGAPSAAFACTKPDPTTGACEDLSTDPLEVRLAAHTSEDDHADRKRTVNSKIDFRVSRTDGAPLSPADAVHCEMNVVSSQTVFGPDPSNPYGVSNSQDPTGGPDYHEKIQGCQFGAGKLLGELDYSSPTVDQVQFEITDPHGGVHFSNAALVVFTDGPRLVYCPRFEDRGKICDDSGKEVKQAVKDVAEWGLRADTLLHCGELAASLIEAGPAASVTGCALSIAGELALSVLLHDPPDRAGRTLALPQAFPASGRFRVRCHPAARAPCARLRVAYGRWQVADAARVSSLEALARTGNRAQSALATKDYSALAAQNATLRVLAGVTLRAFHVERVSRLRLASAISRAHLDRHVDSRLILAQVIRRSAHGISLPRWLIRRLVGDRFARSRAEVARALARTLRTPGTPPTTLVQILRARELDLSRLRAASASVAVADVETVAVALERQGAVSPGLLVRLAPDMRTLRDACTSTARTTAKGRLLVDLRQIPAKPVFEFLSAAVRAVGPRAALPAVANC